MFKRIVNAIEYVALACAVVTVVLLFADRPSVSRAASTQYASTTGTSRAASAPAFTDAQVAAGAPIFADKCSGCHGSSGEGGIGPKLRGGTVSLRYPDPAAEIAIVTNGEDGMPSWRASLSPAEIEAVVAYTRSGLR